MPGIIDEMIKAAVTGIIVEVDGLVYGPFADKEIALAWALSKNKSPFSMKIMVDPRIG